ncbi:NCK-interacting protein with SH3 domain [Phthorimaea operculella]|nr:NCK-interacting protein with SH3 domain [Phthorimaea operculella]
MRDNPRAVSRLSHSALLLSMVLSMGDKLPVTHFERTALATLALSALPAEIARDMRDNPRAVSRLSHSALLLSMVLSMGDKLPVTHFEQLGVEFAEFLLDLIENPPETDVDEQIPDLFLTLLLAYNLQFDNPFDNLLLNALENRDNAKTFCEKVLLLLNREEDPVHIFDHEPAPAHSVLKLVIDLFSRKKTADHFYTNDVNVTIDIIVRQLADLSPGDTLKLAIELFSRKKTADHFYTNDVNVTIDIIVRQLADLSPGDTRRQQYLKILQGIIRNTDYGAHLHRRDDLLRCFARIFCEEGDCSRDDQALVRAISNEFPHYFKA